MSTALEKLETLSKFRRGLRSWANLLKEYTEKEASDTTTKEELTEVLEITGESLNEENIDI